MYVKHGYVVISAFCRELDSTVMRRAKTHNFALQVVLILEVCKFPEKGHVTTETLFGFG